jgi:hypothetical protein
LIAQTVFSRRLYRAAALALAGLIAAGCTATASIPADFPTPLVDPLPIRVGVRYPEHFLTYQHREQIPSDREWVVELGDANAALFDSVFGSMFDATEPVNEEAERIAATAGLDAIIEPELESYEFSVPLETGDPFYSVWMTYRMRLFSAEGRLIAEWPVRAYGKSRYKILDSDQSLAQATIMAMRDAGAELALQFASQPRIREWLREEGKVLPDDTGDQDVQIEEIIVP